MNLSLYIHIPFCVRKCLYCDFNSVADAPVPLAEYVAGVVRELALRTATLPEPPKSSTLFFGGGTPSLLPPEGVAQIIAAAVTHGGLLPDAEVTLEANPGTVTADSLAGYRLAGVNRLSLGVQSFDDPLLARLGRVHTAAEAEAAFRLARQAGFSNIGIDLIHSLPGQDPGLWQRDLERAVALGPDHISAYALSVEEGTPFARMDEAGTLALPSDDDAAAMFALTTALLARHGFQQYEIANFARPGRRSRHNQVYWHRGNYLGIGAGAHSFLREPGYGCRWRNPAGIEPWLAGVRNGAPDREELHDLTRQEAMGEFLFLGLRLLEGIDEAGFAREFGIPATEAFGPEIGELLANGLLVREEGRLRLSGRAVALANQVFCRFV